MVSGDAFGFCSDVPIGERSTSSTVYPYSYSCPTFGRNQVSKGGRKRIKAGEGVLDTGGWIGPHLRPTGISLTLSCSKKKTTSPIQEGNEVRSYEDYRKVTKECDEEFLKKCGRDLNDSNFYESHLKFR